MRRKIAISNRKEHGILKALGYSETQDIVTSKVKGINKLVYDEVKSDNRLYICSEPADIQNYIDEVLIEVGRKNQGPFEKGKNQASSDAQK